MRTVTRKSKIIPAVFETVLELDEEGKEHEVQKLVTPGQTIALDEYETVDAWPLEETKQFLIAEFKKQMSAKLEELVPPFKQINAALGIYTPDETDRITKTIATVRLEVKNYEEKINACQTHDELYK